MLGKIINSDFVSKLPLSSAYISRVELFSVDGKLVFHRSVCTHTSARDSAGSRRMMFAQLGLLGNLTNVVSSYRQRGDCDKAGSHGNGRIPRHFP
jgi:hypothetical protein